MKLKWDEIGKKFYKTGVDHAVLYPQKNGAYPKGTSWSGVTSVAKNPSGAEDNKQYADNMVYLNLKSVETLGLTLECFFYPDEWKACNGETPVSDGVTIGQQRRNTFGLAYRTKIGNDTDGEDYAFELNLIYGCSSAPSEESSTTVNESPEASTFSYTITTTPVNVSGKDADGKPYKPTACLSLDSRFVDPDKLAEIEKILYGEDPTDDNPDGVDARLPLPDEIIQIMSTNG